MEGHWKRKVVYDRFARTRPALVLPDRERHMDNAEFEPRFLLDYLWFGCMILAHQSRVLNEAHAAEADADRRRAYLLAIHTNLIQECEHVAAWLLAFRRWGASRTPLIETLLRYKPGEAYLEACLGGVADGHDLLRVSGIDRDRLVPMYIPRDQFDDRVADLWAGFSYYADQQGERAQLYNKSKHGMVFVSSARVLNAQVNDIGPLALYAHDRHADPIRVAHIGLRDAPDQPGVMARQTRKMAHALGDIILFYLLQEHPASEADVNETLNSRESMLMLPPGDPSW